MQINRVHSYGRPWGGGRKVNEGERDTHVLETEEKGTDRTEGAGQLMLVGEAGRIRHATRQEFLCC